MKTFKQILQEAKTGAQASARSTLRNLTKKIKAGVYSSLGNDEKQELLSHLGKINNSRNFGWRTVGAAFANAHQILKTNGINHAATSIIAQRATEHDRELSDERESYRSSRR